MTDEPQSTHYEYVEPWGEVLRDGKSFCHWGGRAASEFILSRVQPVGRLLDLCCGEGGTLSLVEGSETFGLDISSDAIHQARRVAPNAALIRGDANELPFCDACFRSVIMQDGDAWLGGRVATVLDEVARVVEDGGAVALQVYGETSECSEEQRSKTQHYLSALGYPDARIPTVAAVEARLPLAGLTLTEAIDMHDVYAADAATMAATGSARGNSMPSALVNWLLWADVLYAEKAWTGRLFVAQRDPRGA